MKTIVVTGGIGSGKSLLSSLLVKRGIPVYDCDTRVKELYLSHPELRALLVPDIFERPEALATLEGALFPVLMEDFRQWAGSLGKELVAMESATILDKAYFNGFGDIVLYVDAPVEIRLERAARRGGITRESILRRMELQGDHRNDPRVNAVLDNDSTPEALDRKLEAFLSAQKK